MYNIKDFQNEIIIKKTMNHIVLFFKNLKDGNIIFQLLDDKKIKIINKKEEKIVDVADDLEAKLISFIDEKRKLDETNDLICLVKLENKKDFNILQEILIL